MECPFPSSQFSAGLAAKLCAAWSKAGGSPTDLNRLAQNKSALQSVMALVRGHAQVEISSIIKIDRSKPVLSTNIWPDETLSVFSQNAKCADLTEVDLRLVRLEHTLRDGEEFVGWEERMGRHAVADYTLLDIRVLEYLIENPYQIPAEWRSKDRHDTIVVCFDGTIFIDPKDNRKSVMGLSWDFDENQWGLHLYDEMEWTGFDHEMWRRHYPSAVLIKST